jgi:hypothetical protein
MLDPSLPARPAKDMVSRERFDASPGGGATPEIVVFPARRGFVETSHPRPETSAERRAAMHRIACGAGVGHIHTPFEEAARVIQIVRTQHVAGIEKHDKGAVYCPDGAIVRGGPAVLAPAANEAEARAKLTKLLDYIRRLAVRGVVHNAQFVIGVITENRSGGIAQKASIAAAGDHDVPRAGWRRRASPADHLKGLPHGQPFAQPVIRLPPLRNPFGVVILEAANPRRHGVVAAGHQNREKSVGLALEEAVAAQILGNLVENARPLFHEEGAPAQQSCLAIAVHFTVSGG